MAGLIIPLSKPRALNGRGLIITGIRRDITDYGSPGDHLHGPLALKARAKSSILGIPGAPGPSAEEAQLDECNGRAGNVVSFLFGAIAASTAVARVSQRIAGPFIITGLISVADVAFTVAVDLDILISDDADTTGFPNTTGQSLSKFQGTGEPWRIGTGLAHIPLRHKVLEIGKRIKISFNNGSAAAASAHIWVTILLL